MSAPYIAPLALIDTDNTCWPRFALDQDRVQEFARFYLDAPLESVDPLQVVARENGRLLLINGRHRYTALSKIGAHQAWVQVIDCPHPDVVQFAYEYALADSSRSALPLTRAEKHRAVVRLLNDSTGRTDVAIGALVGVSSKTVQRTRKWLDDNPTPATTEEEPPTARAPKRSTSEDAARAMVRHLQKVWDARSAGMSLGLSDTAKLGDQIGAAFVERVGADEAVAWTERFTTWASRAHATALAARQDDT